jgi:hypothetical protein
MKWITRERAKVDRIARPWLISRFIDPQPEFLYVLADQVLAEAAAQGDIPYDIPGVELGHKGPLCSFDALMHKYGLQGTQQFPLMNGESYVPVAADSSRSVSTTHCRLLKRLSRSARTRYLVGSRLIS